jgi:C4-dicarboxylate-specific signal transduction histidine kinase
LDFARTGSGVVENVSVGTAVQEAVDTFGMQPEARDVQLQISCAPDLPDVRIERDKLHQVLVNLMVNSMHAQAHQSERTISLRACLEPSVEGAVQHVELVCEDTGPGFSPVALDRAFEPFFTTKDVGAGTGLGLATCLRVVEAAGGHISMGNRQEGGAWVRIRLPSV